MSILKKLNTDGSNLSKLDGTTPKTPDFAGSKLHNLYSTIGNPSLRDKPQPSNLDNEAIVKYLDNLPK
jgi:hypothetical protein